MENERFVRRVVEELLEIKEINHCFIVAVNYCFKGEIL